MLLAGDWLRSLLAEMTLNFPGGYASQKRLEGAGQKGLPSGYNHSLHPGFLPSHVISWWYVCPLSQVSSAKRWVHLDKVFQCPWLLGPPLCPSKLHGTSTMHPYFPGHLPRPQECPTPSACPEIRDLIPASARHPQFGQPRNPWSPTLPPTIGPRGHSLPRQGRDLPRVTQQGFSQTPRCPLGSRAGLFPPTRLPTRGALLDDGFIREKAQT